MTSNGSPFLLGPLGAMLPVDAEPGVAVSAERGTSATIASGGARRVQRSRHAPRTWDVSIVDQTPDVVALLELAAQGALGDVWLLDRAAARANMLWPWQVASEIPTRPRLTCAGFPLRSLTQGPTYTIVRDVACAADAVVDSDAPLVNSGSTTALAVSSTKSVLLRFPIPKAPVGTISTTATLQTVRSATGGSATAVRTTGDGWRESLVTYSTTPSLTQAAVGELAAAGTSPSTVLSLGTGGVAAYEGANMSLALTSTGATAGTYVSREGAPGQRPVLRLVYTVSSTADVEEVRVPVRPGVYTVSGWTDITSSGTAAQWSTDAGQSGSIARPAGAGAVVRWASSITVTAHTVLTVRVVGTTAGLIAGLRVHEGSDDGVPFLAGRGTPCRVAVSDPALNLTYWRAGEQGRGDYTVQLLEVGVPGEV